MANWRLWFAQMWTRQGRNLAGEIASVGTHKLFLADLALRGNVYAAAPASRDLFEAGLAEGRRRLALETIKLCRVPASELFELLDPLPPPPEPPPRR